MPHGGLADILTCTPTDPVNVLSCDKWLSRLSCTCSRAQAGANQKTTRSQPEANQNQPWTCQKPARGCPEANQNQPGTNQGRTRPCVLDPGTTGSGILDPGSFILDPGLSILEPGESWTTAIVVPVSRLNSRRIQDDPASWIVDPVPFLIIDLMLDARPCVLDPGTTESGILDPGSFILDPGLSILEPGESWTTAVVVPVSRLNSRRIQDDPASWILDPVPFLIIDLMLDARPCVLDPGTTGSGILDPGSSWNAFCRAFGNLFGSLWDTLGDLGVTLGHLGVTWDPLGLLWGAPGRSWDSTLRHLDVFLTFWVQKFSQGTEKHYLLCI
jgi:hypothetical protein